MVRVGFIGCGRISDLHAAPYLGDPDAEIVAIADVDPALLAQRGERWSVPESSRFTDHRELLASDGLDLVEILAPHHLHHQMTLDALATGRHVSVQKPMATSLAQADEMCDAADAAAGLCRVYENFVHYPPIRFARELIDAGEIGDPLTIRIKSNPGRSDTAWEVPQAAAQWRFDPERCGGGPLTFDDGHHKFAIAWYLMGAPTDVHAWIVQKELAPGFVLDAPAVISWRFADQRLGSFEVVYSPGLDIHTTEYAQDDRVEITGTDGIIWVTRGHGYTTVQPPVILYRGHSTRGFTHLPTSWSSSFDAATAHLLDVLRNGGDPSLTAAQGRDVLSFALAAQESARAGRAVVVPPGRSS